MQVPVEEPIKEIKELLLKQTDEFEKILSEKINVIENLIESTKKSISQFQLMQHEIVNNGSKDINDASFIGGCRRKSTIDKPPFANQNMLVPHDVSISQRRISSSDKPIFVNENPSIPHDVNVKCRKISTITNPLFANQNTTAFPHDVNISFRKKSNTDKPILPHKENLK